MATRAKELSDLGNSGHLNVHDNGTVTLEGGSVGIGTTSPNAILDVRGGAASRPTFIHASGYGGIQIAGTGSGSGGALIFSNNYNTSVSEEYSIHLDGATDDLVFISGDPADIATQERMRLTDDGKVGIGTTSPVGTLHLHSADTGLRLTSNQGSNTPLAQLQYSGSGGYFLRMGDSSNNEDVMIRTYGNSHFNGGNVGIGDTTPTEGKLVVRGDANTNGLFVGGNSTTGQSYGALINAGTNSSDANFRLYDQSGSTPYLFVRGDGNVSINTDTPDIFNFRIATDSILSGSDYSWPFDITRAGQTNSRGFSVGQQTGGGVTALGNHNGDIALGHTYGSDSNGQPIFYETMRIEHIDQDVGRVGIGTTSPQGKLHIDQGHLFLNKTMVQDNSSTDFDFIEMKYAGGWSNNQGGLASISATDGTGVVGRFGVTYRTGSGDTGGSFVVSDLYQGGYGASGEVFEVNNDRAIIPSVLNFSNTKSSSFIQNTSGNVLEIRSDNQMEFFTYSGSWQKRMVISDGGNVGIGTTSPTHRLQVNGTAADGTELLHILSNGNVADGGYHWMSSAIASGQTTNANIVHMIGRELASKNSGYFGFHYAGDHSDDNFITIGGYAADQLLNIKMNGNVGIGTTSPDYTLVVGNNSTYHTLKVQGINANLAATVKFKHHGGGGRNGIDPEWNISRGSNQTSFNTGVTSGNALVGGLVFWNNTIGGSNVDAMRLKDNGDAIFGYNVGIGITNPSEKLHVSGNILVTGVVNASSDISLKDNITPIPNAIDKVLQIRGVTFNRNDIEDNPRQAGIIAQEVEKVLPEVVSEDKDGIKSVAYGNMVSLLIEAIKEQQGQINMLKEKLENK